MSEAMTKWERVRAAVRKDETDRIPVAFYKHFPEEDMTVDGLANATIRWQKNYD